MNNCVQLDLFNTITPVAVFDWADKTNINVFEYSDDIQFDDVILENNYIVNVPCYKIEDLIGMFDTSDKGQYESDRNHIFWKLARNKKLNSCVVRISNKDRYSCGDKWFILANPKMKKFIEQQTIVAMLKGTIKKAPRLYKKVVQVDDITYRKDLKANFVSVYTLSKWHSDFIKEKIS